MIITNNCVERKEKFEYHAKPRSEATVAVIIITIMIGIDNCFVQDGYEYKYGTTTALEVRATITTGIHFVNGFGYRAFGYVLLVINIFKILNGLADTTVDIES